MSSVEIKTFDGLCWEKSITTSAIKACSKEAPAAQVKAPAAPTEAAAKPKKPRSAASEAGGGALAPLWSLVEVLFTFLMPFVLILLITYNRGGLKKMPGKAQDDIGMHHDAISAPWW